MKTKNAFLVPALIAGLGFLPAGRVAAQTFTTLHSFNHGSDGASPADRLVLSGNTLYGTAANGGNANRGTLFAVNTDGTGFTNLHDFTATSGLGFNSDGTSPFAGLTLFGNTLYGTAENGGSANRGTVFKVNTDGTGFTTLHNFTAGSGSYPNVTNSDGAFTYSALVFSDNTLYGTAYGGGSSGNGTVFAVKTDGTGFTNLHTFTALSNTTNSDGAVPYAGLILSGNTLYGTAYRGGHSHHGTLFKINTDGTGFTNLHTFTAGVGAPYFTNSDGAHPFGRLAISGDTLYGGTDAGGDSGFGTLFKVNTDGTDFTTLHHFATGSGALPSSFTNSDGTFPSGLLVSGNTLYAATSAGGNSGFGTLFVIKTDGTGFTTLHHFTYGSDGAYPSAGLIFSGNSLYGAAFDGGSSGGGTVFSLSVASGSAPQLTITPSGANVILTWPTNYGGFIYEGNFYDGYTLASTTNLVAPVVWTPVSPGPDVANGQLVVTNSISGSQQFFRLSQPPGCWPAPPGCGYVCVNGVWVKNTQCGGYE